MSLRIWLPASVLLATLLAYFGVFQFQFVFDDQALLVDNPIIRSWRYLPVYFSTSLEHALDPRTAGNYYRPLYLVWQRLCYAAFGLNPVGWHAATLCLHLLATLLVFYLALRLGARDSTAALAAALFALHPLRVESVAWITGANETLPAVPLLLALLLYLRGRDGPRWATGASLAMAALALLAKETPAVLPVIIFSYEYFVPGPEEGKTLRALRRSWPYFAVVFLYLPLRFWALKGLAHVNNPMSVASFLLTLPSILVFYLRLLLWPVGLSVFYDTNAVTRAGLSSFWIPLLLLLLLASALWFWQRRKPGRRAFLIAFSLLTLIPALNLWAFPSSELAHDRYLYLPSVGFFLALALTLDELPLEQRLHRFRSSLLYAGAGLALLLGILTLWQTTYWADDLVLFSRGVAVAPHDLLARIDLGYAYYQRGMIEPAMQQFAAALQLNPRHLFANSNLGVLNFQQGRYRQAEPYLRQAVAIDPDDAISQFYLGWSRLEDGRPAEAIPPLEKALSLSPSALHYSYLLGLACQRTGDLARARRLFQQELRLHPGDPEAQSALAQMDSSSLRKNR